MKNNIYNAVMFNIAWLVCVLGGSRVAVIAAIIVIAIHLNFFSKHKIELAFIGVVVLLGLVIDGALMRSGLLLAPDGSVWPPLWLVSLWALFATTINHSLKWFQTHLRLAVVLGGVSGTVSYLAGTRLTEFSLREPQMLTLGLIFLVWSVVFPFCLMLAKNLLDEQRQQLQG